MFCYTVMMNWFQKLIKKVTKAEAEEVSNENNINNNLIDEDFCIKLEEQLLYADCGLELTEFILDKLNNKKLTVSEAQELINNSLAEVLEVKSSESQEKKINNNLVVRFIIGVNGSGKTTSIGKLTNYYQAQGKRVLIAPCDTFRAGAYNQVKIWAERTGAELYQPSNSKHKANAILFEAIQKAQEEKFDILLVDTAGRLQNKQDLMQELEALSRVLDKHLGDNAAIERLMVLDSTTGQNGLKQAMEFNNICPLDGIVLTKFDGSAKGGIVFAIAHNLQIPVKFLGTGEKLENLEVFKKEKFIQEFLL